MLPQRILAWRSRQPFCFHILAASWVSFCNTLPLFSIVYSLFLENTGGGCIPSRSHLLESATYRLFFRASVCKSVTPVASTVPRLWGIEFCSSFVFTTIRIAFPATALFSQPPDCAGVYPQLPHFSGPRSPGGAKSGNSPFSAIQAFPLLLQCGGIAMCNFCVSAAY